MKNLQNFFRKKKILITGNTGFKGSWLSKVLLYFGANVIGIGLPPSTKPDAFHAMNLEKQMKTYFCDIRNVQKIKKIIANEKTEIIFHLAAQPLVRDSYDDPLYTFETNILGTANLLQSGKEAPRTKAIVVVTTDKVYEEKKNKKESYKEEDRLGGYDPYSASKACAEIVTDCYRKSFFSDQTLVATARSGNVIGGGDWQKDRIIPDLVRSVFEKKSKLKIRNPEAIRPWQHVLDPLFGYLLLAKKLFEGKKNFADAWNFGPDNRNILNVKKLAEKSFKMLKKGTFVIEKSAEKHEAQYLQLDAEKAQKMLNWKAKIDINEALKWTFKWYEHFYDKSRSTKTMEKMTDEQIQLFLKKQQ